MNSQFIKPLLAALAAGVILALAVILTLAPKAQAADLSGRNDMSDLEERVAELEATVARKGNRKVNLYIYGQVNASVLNFDLDAGDEGKFSDTQIIQNGIEETFVGFRGVGRVTKDVTAGFVLEIEYRQLGLLDLPVKSNEVTLRQSYVYVRSESLGGVSIGKQAQATNDFDRINTANTAVATKPLSLQPISDIYLTGFDLPLDGGYKNVVRYSTPVWAGFSASASWADGVGLDFTSPSGVKDTRSWDAAARYVGEFSGIQVVGGLGWRHDEDLDINLLNIVTLSLGTGDVQTKLAALSVKHAVSGLFLTGNYADQDWAKDSLLPNLSVEAWNLQGGIEQRWVNVGHTTLYAEYGKTEVSVDGDSIDVDVWGGGVVQALDGAGTDLYLSFKDYSVGTKEILGTDVDARVIQGGARVKF